LHGPAAVLTSTYVVTYPTPLIDLSLTSLLTSLLTTLSTTLSTSFSTCWRSACGQFAH
jgi:hypothetical protein